MSDDIPIIAGCGNVFADLNVAKPEVALAKATPVQQIIALVYARKPTDAAAAELLGFSTEQLTRFLTAFGQGVEIVVTAPSGRRRAKGRLTVRTA